MIIPLLGGYFVLIECLKGKLCFEIDKLFDLKAL